MPTPHRSIMRLGLLAFVFVGLAHAAGRARFDPGDILEYREKKDAYFRDSAQSPFKAPPAVTFAPLKYFPPDASWIFHSELHPYSKPEAVTILDTKGRKRDGVVFGTLSFSKDGRTHTLRLYRMNNVGGAVSWALWFTDRTTGVTTYDVGRYLDFEKSDDPEHVYTLDFNLAYNPYCAYTSAYGCAIPRKEDHLDLAVTAGEKKWKE